MLALVLALAITPSAQAGTFSAWCRKILGPNPNLLLFVSVEDRIASLRADFPDNDKAYLWWLNDIYEQTAKRLIHSRWRLRESFRGELRVLGAEIRKLDPCSPALRRHQRLEKPRAIKADRCPRAAPPVL
jgi:hypothetical protein